MASSDKNRLWVFLLFMILLIAFGILYRPADASSRPADKNAPAVLPVEK